MVPKLLAVPEKEGDTARRSGTSGRQQSRSRPTLHATHDAACSINTFYTIKVCLAEDGKEEDGGANARATGSTNRDEPAACSWLSSSTKAAGLIVPP